MFPLMFGDDYRCFLRYETNGGTIDTLTVQDCTTGYKQQYCINITHAKSHERLHFFARIIAT